MPALLKEGAAQNSHLTHDLAANLAANKKGPRFAPEALLML